MIRLSDAELDAIMSLAQPIDVDLRDAFLQAVAAELARCETIGVGVIHRVASEQQRKFFVSPISDQRGPNKSIGKYSRL